MNDLDKALPLLDDLASTLSAIEDNAGDAREELGRIRERLEPALRLVPPAARSFEVTDDDVEHLRAEMRLETGTDPGDYEARAVLVSVYAHLASRTQAGGPEVTEADLLQSQAVLQQASRDQRNVLEALLEHDRAKLWARTSGGVS